jgi:acetyltransferase-like isoleucine patch superfamily enzyme
MTFRPFFLTALLLGTGVAHAQTDSFTFPADLTHNPFNCVPNGTAYNCPAISLSKQTDIKLTEPVSLNVTGGFTADKEFTTINNGNKFTVVVSGNVNFQKDLTATMDLQAAGWVKLDKDAHVTGNITTAGNLTVAKDSWIAGNVVVSGNLDMGKDSYITGTCTVTGTTNYACNGTAPPPSTRHHVRLNHLGKALTCTPAQVTVYACSSADSGGSCTPDTSGVSGNVLASYNGGTLAVPFAIAAGNSSVTVDVGVTVAGNATLSTSGLSPSPLNSTTCWNSAAGMNSCVLDFEDSGFVLDIPDHYSDSVQNFQISAVRKGSGSQQACAPAFANVAKNVTFSCTYVSAHVGSLAPAFGPGSSAGTALACGSGSNLNLSLNFNANGIANANVRFADAGKVNVQVDSGGISGSDDFIAVPRNFLVQLPDAADSYVAGVPFNVRTQARNISNSVTPSYGPGNAATLTLQRCQPRTTDAKDGVLSNTALTFANGIGSATPGWSEVGNADITATDANYQGQTALTITGTSNASGTSCGGNNGAAGPFRPHHFTTTVTRVPSFTYSGQPIPLTVAAFNAAGGATENYYYVDTATQPGIGFSRQVTITAFNPTSGAAIPPATGAMSDNTVPDTQFMPGGAALAKPKFTFANIFTAPTSIRLRAATATPVVSSAGYSEGVTEIRSGRLRLTNVFGSATQTAKMPVRAEYWTGQSWLLNSLDTGTDATRVPKAAVALSPTGSGSVMSADVILVNGQGLITLTPPAKPGYVDLAVNLGATNTDASCLSTHPATTGSIQDWLRSQYGNCGSKADPSARASFGIYAPGTNRAIHIRERFN